ncbi:MAG TPA: hypothetical protein VD793_01810 [Gemmatimonadales bacterium]|nr:hypothetical protein [Gemmatimonadales bacterium]
MNSSDRRSFLKRLAKGAAYATPVIQSFAVPAELVGQGAASQKKPPMARGFAEDPAASPWNAPPPGKEP